MTRRCSLLGFWLIFLILASACEPARPSFDSLTGSSAILSTVPAALPARLSSLPAATPSSPASTSLPLASLTPFPVEVKEFANIAYAHIPDVDPNLLSLDIYTSAKITTSRPVMIYVHGGGWSAGDKKEVNHKPRFFVEAGFVFVSVNYRLSPKAKFPAHAQDVAAAVAWVSQHISQYGGDPEKISLMGHSAGAHLAVLISTDEQYLKEQGLSLKNIRAVISLDTAGYDLAVFADRCKGKKLPEPYGTAFGQVPADWKAASPASYIKSGKSIPPIVVVYSGDVGIGSSVTRELMAEEFSKTLSEAGVIHDLEGAPDKNHSEISTDFGRPGDTLSENVLISLKKIAPKAY